MKDKTASLIFYPLSFPMNTPRLFARPQTEASGWNSELALRYGAATLVTLIALAAAQLVLPTQLMLALGAITVTGVPVALWMRFHEMRIGGLAVPRPLWNALTVLASCAASAFFLRVPLRNIFAAIEGGMSDASLLRMGATEPMLLLVQLFLIFAAFRSFSIISDKDATLATVPSFSVLLLLIPVYPNIEVVCYFLLWTMVATMLFALDHRSEIRAQVTATVPAPAPGQDVKLAARSLAGVLGFSLIVAVALSGLLTARDPREGSESESAISLLASRLTQFTLQNQNASVNNGPERQIDFAAGTSLPTRAVLWQASTITQAGEPLNPLYWRLFALSDYNGSTWTQNNGGALTIERVPLTRSQWPRLRDGDSGGGRSGGGRHDEQRPRQNGRRGDGLTPRNQGNNRDASTFGVSKDGDARVSELKGFVLDKALPSLASSFGTSRETVRSRLISTRTSLGFVPLLPAPTLLILRDNEQSTLRVRADGGIDVSLVENNQRLSILSQVPKLPEYGFASAGPPRERVVAAANAPKLSATERASNLKLPAKLPARVRQLARAATRGAGPNSNNYARALLLARATQRGAIYTLRPPTIPADRDAADFFLFESRRGYCTYFAGALTVLCRAQNIPARVVSGFVAPDQTGQGNSTIRDANAHAWTEVWIENWGWAIVDATPPDDRGDNAPTFLENWSDLAAAHLDTALRWSITHWATLVSGGGLLLLAFGAWRFRRNLARWLGRETVEDVEVLRRQVAADYARAARQLARRFRPRQAWETPDEWLRAARTAVPQLPFEPLQILTALYVRARFSPHELSHEAAQQARAARERLKWKQT